MARNLSLEKRLERLERLASRQAKEIRSLKARLRVSENAVVKLRAKQILAKKRKPLARKAPRPWKLEMITGYLLVKTTGTTERREPTVRVWRYYKIKPQKRWIAGWKARAEELFQQQEEDWEREYDVVSLERKYAEDIEKVEYDEIKIPLGETWIKITGEPMRELG